MVLSAMYENPPSQQDHPSPAKNPSLLRAVFDSALDGLVTIDERGVIELVNPAVQELFGYAREELIGQNVRVLMPEPYRSRHDEFIRRFLETDERRIIGIGREVVGLRRDGSTFPVELAVSQFQINGQRRFLGLLRDITERKEHEAALIAQAAHQRGRTEVASSILHDLGNALSGIGSRLSNARALVDDKGPADNLRRTISFMTTHEPELERALGDKAEPLVLMLKAIAKASSGNGQRIGEDIDKALSFIAHAQEVLAIYRRYTGAGSGPAREPVELSKLLLDAQMLMSDAMAKRGGVIQLRIAEGLPPLHAERSKIMQVLLNLLKNSIEALDDGPPEAPVIVIRAARVDDKLELELTDNGPGFGPEVAERLFVEGFSTKARSSGLGLAGCRRIARSLGGDVTLESSGLGRGARALLSLPIEPNQ